MVTKKPIKNTSVDDTEDSEDTVVSNKKKLSFDEAFGKIKKDLRQRNPSILSDKDSKVEFISTGCFVADLICGGGFPVGRLTEVFGLEHSGKSSLCYSAIKTVVDSGKIAILVDAENAWDPTFGRKVFGLEDGVGSFRVLSPSNLEEIAKVMETVAVMDNVGILVFDSVDAMKPKDVIEESLENNLQLAAHARAIGRFVTQMKQLARDMNIPIVFVNQMRSAPKTNRFEQATSGTGAGFEVSDNYVCSGGKSLLYYSSLRLKLEPAGRITKEESLNMIDGSKTKSRVGTKIRISCAKNKVGIPFLSYKASFMFPIGDTKCGWDNAQDVIEILQNRKRIQHKGKTMMYKGLNIPEWKSSLGSEANLSKFYNDKDVLADAFSLALSYINSDDVFGEEESSTEEDFV